jgi:hypothetical protein
MKLKATINSPSDIFYHIIILNIILYLIINLFHSTKTGQWSECL